jgi:hypothetical protein
MIKPHSVADNLGWIAITNVYSGIFYTPIIARF